MEGLDWRRRRVPVALVMALLAVAALVGVAGCGSSSDSSSSDTSGSESSGSEAGGSDATAQLEAAQKGPTEWEGPTEPTKPPQTFNLALVTCDNASDGCSAPAKGSEEAAKLLGWNVKTYDGESDPTVQAKRVQQAIANGADGIITESVDGRGIGSALAAAKSAGIPGHLHLQRRRPRRAGLQGRRLADFEQLGKDIAAG